MILKWWTCFVSFLATKQLLLKVTSVQSLNRCSAHQLPLACALSFPLSVF